MDYKILWDNNIILDLFLLRTKENPYIRDIELFFVESNIPIYLSSSQLHNIKFILSKHLKQNNISVSANEIIKKFLETHIVKILKTPSYISLEDWALNTDIEDELIRLTAETFDVYVLTRDEEFLTKLGNKGIHPKDLESFIKNRKRKTISMLDLTAETIYQYENIEKNIDKVIKKSNFILGDEVKQLEGKIASYIGTKYAIGVSSGTDALVLSLRALAIQRKKQEYWDIEDLIITTPFTFTATGDAILRAGATPLFVDIDLDTYDINPELVEKAVKKYGKRVKGIIPVHLYGQPCDMDKIMKIAKEYNLFVVEDCAQSFGAKWGNKRTGSFGDTGCFSFFPSKNLGGFGDGGMITTNDEQLYEIITMLRKHGGKDKYNVDHIGYNARLDTIQAAVLLAKLNYIDEFTEKRRNIAKFYTENLKNINWLKTPYVENKAYHVFHQYTIRIMEKNREEIQQKLKEKGVQTMVYYPVPLHKMKVFKNNGMEIFDDLKNSEIASRNVLSLPIEPLFGISNIEKIVNVLKDEI
jgi:dTDP-4-amino-4,6-dideoxygalactose transaminase/rRNA-processing protein FCF1